jgi:hypothetical protein
MVLGTKPWPPIQLFFILLHFTCTLGCSLIWELMHTVEIILSCWHTYNIVPAQQKHPGKCSPINNLFLPQQSHLNGQFVEAIQSQTLAAPALVPPSGRKNLPAKKPYITCIDCYYWKGTLFFCWIFLFLTWNSLFFTNTRGEGLYSSCSTCYLLPSFMMCLSYLHIPHNMYLCVSLSNQFFCLFVIISLYIAVCSCLLGSAVVVVVEVRLDKLKAPSMYSRLLTSSSSRPDRHPRWANCAL